MFSIRVNEIGIESEFQTVVLLAWAKNNSEAAVGPTVAVPI